MSERFTTCLMLTVAGFNLGVAAVTFVVSRSRPRADVPRVMDRWIFPGSNLLIGLLLVLMFAFPS